MMLILLVITLKLREKLQVLIGEFNFLQVIDLMAFLLFKTQPHTLLEAKIEAENLNINSFL